MDVNNTEARREIELANRLLRDRESDHARELDNVRKSSQEQLAEVDASHSQNLKRIRESAEGEVDGARKRFDESVHATTDSFERKLGEERSEGYDRYGRLATDTARERAKAEEIKTRQIGDLIYANENDKKMSEETHKHSLKNSEDAFLAERQGVIDSFDKKMAAKDEMNQKTRKRELADSAEAVREAQSKGARMNLHDGSSAQSRYNKLLEDSQYSQERLMKAGKLREEELKGDSALNLQRQRQAGQKSFDELSERASDELNSRIHGDNAERIQSARTNEAKMNHLLQDNEIDKQHLRSGFRAAISDLESASDVEKSRSELKKTLSDKQHRQEMNLNTEALTVANNLNADESRARYQERVRDIEDTAHRAYQKRDVDAQNKAYETEMSHNAERSDVDLNHYASVHRLAAENQRARNNIIREYEARQRGTEETAEKQRAETQAATRNELKAIREHTDKEIEGANREKTAGVYGGQLALRNRTDELEAMRRMEVDDAQATYHDRSKRMNEAYNRSLLSNKDAFDEEAQVYKYETMMQIVKNRGDAEHEKRIALLDLLQKNRAQMSSMEAKFNEMKDAHDNELAKMKAENDKALRETSRHAREVVETERTIHGRELEGKDMATKEKLRLQEEAFKDQIEKIKRSNELALKKS